MQYFFRAYGTEQLMYMLLIYLHVAIWSLSSHTFSWKPTQNHRQHSHYNIIVLFQGPVHERFSVPSTPDLWRVVLSKCFSELTGSTGRRLVPGGGGGGWGHSDQQLDPFISPPSTDLAASRSADGNCTRTLSGVGRRPNDWRVAAIAVRGDTSTVRETLYNGSDVTGLGQEQCVNGVKVRGSTENGSTVPG